MDRAQTRLLVVLSLVVSAVAGVLWWQGDPKTDGDAEAVASVWTVDAASLRRLEVDRTEGRLVVERDEDDWWVREPFDALADPARVADLVGALAPMERGIPVEAPRPEEFGLGEPPAARVRWVPDAGEPVVLDVGERAPVGYTTYVRAGAGVVAANGDPTALLHAPADSFRDHRVFRFDPSTVRSVRVAFPDHTLEVTGAGRSWAVRGYGRADPDRVDDLVMDLLDVRFDEEVPGIVVEAPRVVVEVALEGGVRERLSLGSDDGSGLPAVAADGRTGHVFAGVEKMLGRGPTDVGQRTAFQIRPDVADAVRFEGLGHTLHARREGPDWVSPPTDPGKVYDLVLALSSLPVERSLAPAGPSDPPEAHVTVEEEGLSVTFVVGPVQPDGTRTVRDAASPEPGVRVRDAAFAELLKELP